VERGEREREKKKKKKKKSVQTAGEKRKGRPEAVKARTHRKNVFM